jgi:predicted ribosomally synthesized peptide with SipW-like signal peptide
VNTSRKVLRTLVLLGVVGGLAALGAFSAFSSQADNPGNTITAGTVTLADNDGGAALYSIADAKPGDTSGPQCIRVSYTGSLPADVKLYTPSTIGSLGPHVNLKIEAGTQPTPSFPSCTGFNAETTLFDAPLSTFPTSYASGVSDFPGTTATEWANGDAVVYRVTATLAANAPDSAQGASTGTHTLRWEARNQ